MSNLKTWTIVWSSCWSHPWHCMCIIVHIYPHSQTFQSIIFIHTTSFVTLLSAVSFFFWILSTVLGSFLKVEVLKLRLRWIALNGAFVSRVIWSKNEGLVHSREHSSANCTHKPKWERSLSIASSSKIQSPDRRSCLCGGSGFNGRSLEASLEKVHRGRSMKYGTSSKIKFHLWSQMLQTLSPRDAKKEYKSSRPGWLKPSKLQGKMEACGPLPWFPQPFRLKKPVLTC